MGDIYVECGAMTYDEGKAPKEFAAKGKKLLGDTAVSVIKKAKGFTVAKPSGKPEGFTVNLRVSEVVIGDKSVSCKVTGELTTYPKHALVTQKMEANAKATGDASEGAVMDCISSAAEDLVTKAVGVMKKQ